MKQEETKNIDIETIGDESDSIEASISKEGMQMVFEILSNSLYSNPTQSICREITSNCFDSHKEANVESPVIIEMGYDENKDFNYISFEDFGVGMSSERMRKTYMVYLESTKRDSNDYFGLWGIGSKSPLAYTDYFYIRTRFEGIEYEYILSKGEKFPTLDKLIEVKTNEGNGTKIIIPIKEATKYPDTRAFTEACAKQLCYFDDVIFKGFNTHLNNYKIFEGTNFKWRTNAQFSSKVHICLGKVSYPINQDELVLQGKEIEIFPETLNREGIKSRAYVPIHNIPIGLKFEIGELLVTPNRENLRYNPKIRELIIEKLKAAITELQKIFHKQNPHADDIFDYLKRKEDAKVVIFKDENEESYQLDVTEIIKKHEVKFNPLDSLNIKIPNNPFFFLETDRMLVDGNIRKNKRHNSIKTFKEKGTKIALITKEPSKWKNLFLRNAALAKFIYISFDTWCTHLSIPFHTLGKAKIIIAYKREMIKQILNNGGVDYDNLYVSSEWIRDYKSQFHKDDLKELRKINGEVLVHVYEGQEKYKTSNSNRKEPVFDKVTWKLRDVYSFTGLIIYGYKEDIQLLRDVYALLNRRGSLRGSLVVKKSKKRRSINEAFRTIRIAYSAAEVFKGKRPNFIYVKDMISDNKIFRDVATAILINDKHCFIDNYRRQTVEDLAKINYAISNKLAIVRAFIDRNWTTTKDHENISAEFKNEIIEIADKNNWYNIEILTHIKDILAYYEGVPLLHYLTINERSIPHIIEYLKKSKRKVNIEYYNNPVKENIEETIIELQENFNGVPTIETVINNQETVNLAVI